MVVQTDKKHKKSPQSPPAAKKTTVGSSSSGPKVGKEKPDAKKKVNADHPPYSEMILQALEALQRNDQGSSTYDISKYVMDNFAVGQDAKKVQSCVDESVKEALKNKVLVRKENHSMFSSFHHLKCIFVCFYLSLHRLSTWKLTSVPRHRVRLPKKWILLLCPPRGSLSRCPSRNLLSPRRRLRLCLPLQPRRASL